ncbi:MAG: hypothetical protein MJ245_00040 [Clostridia bacterium]|nr:hypothetical protein [Clostridia bacterium]
MEDSFSKLVSILISIIMLCVIPAFYLSMFSDFTSNYYNNYYYTFKLDEMIYKGRINDSDLVSSKDVSIVVEREVYFPEDEEVKVVSFSNDTIENEIDRTGQFKLEIGDDVYITYKLNNDNTFIFLKNIFNIAKDNNADTITYQGVVKNETY